MLGLEDFMTIQALVKRGVYPCDIAEQLGVHPRTVRRTLRRAGPALRRGRRGSRLDPYRPVIDQLLGEGVWNAVVLFRELQDKGYAGGISILRDYVRPKRNVRPGRATVRFETEPGRQPNGADAISAASREVFNDQILATAILDRLLHHATTVNIKGDSYRLREKKKAGLLGRKSKPVEEPEEVGVDACYRPGTQAAGPPRGARPPLGACTSGSTSATGSRGSAIAPPPSRLCR